ncbi:class I SAM-dependent methyltransferase [Stigmatella aurantiaca]|uniref:Methyltransferase n=1 Tax=Stigmatella aurantiaca (strain DW4/3-1) TaxID=378806 RepID=Q094F4_STIAD|nr:methyltransferase domain-containing protein [Stigmatella aurantiaca]ADO68161.1 methyltransferase [Stigmatella aurantiaca DW4/3-1]EAU67130.1 metalloid methyltransferase [Stigmatella aurantiaca DW4/3-1]
MDDGERQRNEAFWAQTVAFWRRYDEMEARLTRPVTERMLALAGLAPGMRVLDIAAGRGEPALPAAHRVGPQGWVLGIDLVEGMLHIARERARREGLNNVEFRAADAESFQAGETLFDVATVRWGLMFMPAPERVLASLHRALKPGGALVIASWADADRVPFASLPRRILERYRDVPLPSSDDRPGIFRHADAARLNALLQQNGFSVEASEEMEAPVVEATQGSVIVAWVREMGGDFVRLVDEMPKPQQLAWEEALASEVEKHRAGEHIVLGGVTRLTLARRT